MENNQKKVQSEQPDPARTQSPTNDTEIFNFQLENLTEFFCGKRKKINIWTYLFREVY